MREIAVVQLGQCGNNLGVKFWEVISGEHGISPNGKYIGSSRQQLEKVNVYYSEAQGKSYVPRAILIDLDKGLLEGVKNGPMGRLFSPDNFISAEKGTGNNWAKGHITEGPKIVDESMDAIRRAVEPCDSLQAFQVIHALGGGTGSGLGVLMLSKLREEYPEKILNTISFLPSPGTSGVVVEPYNCVFTLNYLAESADVTVCPDNEGLNRICTKTLKIPAPGLPEYNRLISCVMSGLSASTRFPGQLNADLRKIQVNLVPYPRLHFFCPSFVPLTPVASAPYRENTASELVRQMLDSKNLMSGCDPRNGKYLSAAALFRGRGISTKEVDTELRKPRGYAAEHVEFIPTGLLTAFCDVPPVGHTTAATFLGNTTAIQEVFRKQVTQHLKMFKKKAFTHWYTDEGMPEDEFVQAGTNVNELISEYLQYQDVKVGQTAESDEDDDDEGGKDTDEDSAGPS